MRVFLYVVIGAAFLIGAQLTVLAEHTDLFFAWRIDVPLTATFIGASYWATAVLAVWGSRQNTWVRARAAVVGVIFVAFGLLVATLNHLEQFGSVLGALWIEGYALIPPIVVAVVVVQLFVPGSDAAPRRRLPPLLRFALAFQALAMLVVGLLLFASPDDFSSMWPWALPPLSSQAVGTWLFGTGVTAGYIAWHDDLHDVPGPALAYIVLSAFIFLGLVRFGGDMEFGEASAWLYMAFYAGTFVTGVYGAVLSWREGYFAPIRPHGGIAVEIKPAAAASPGAPGPGDGSQAVGEARPEAKLS